VPDAGLLVLPEPRTELGELRGAGCSLGVDIQSQRQRDRLRISAGPDRLTVQRAHAAGERASRDVRGMPAIPHPGAARDGGGARTPYPQRNMWLLNGPRREPEIGEVEAASPIGWKRVGPQILHHGNALIGHGATFRHGNAESLELLAQGANADAQNQAAMRQGVKRRRILREADGS